MSRLVNRASVSKWRAEHALRTNVRSPPPPHNNFGFGERFAFAHSRYSGFQVAEARTPEDILVFFSTTRSERPFICRFFSHCPTASNIHRCGKKGCPESFLQLKKKTEDSKKGCNARASQEATNSSTALAQIRLTAEF